MHASNRPDARVETQRGTLPPRPRILLVDDTPIVRFVYTEILVKSGFGVVQAPDAEEARARVLEGIAIDLLLTDYHMPGMNGVQLAKWFQTRRPRTPVLLMSSDSENVRLAKEELAWLHGHEKPSSKKELLRIVHSALGSAAPPVFPETGNQGLFNFQPLEVGRGLPDGR